MEVRGRRMREMDGYRIFLGNPHCHTGYSDGALTPYDALEYARSRGLEFLFITDHSHYLEGNFNDDVVSDISKWKRTGMECDAFNIKHDDFLALRGFEMTSSKWGHINVLNSDDFVEAKRKTKKLEDFFNWLSKNENVIASFNHPSRSFKYISCDEFSKSLFSLMEVGNGSPPRKYIRTEKYYYGALDRGWILGAINGQDNHRDNWGDVPNLTGVISKSLIKKDMIDALQNRRTYSTETGTLMMNFTISGLPMGSIIHYEKTNRYEISLEVFDEKSPIKEVQIITNGGRIAFKKEYKDASEINFKYQMESVDKGSWYLAKVIHSDKKLGISSAIYIL